MRFIEEFFLRLFVSAVIVTSYDSLLLVSQKEKKKTTDVASGVNPCKTSGIPGYL